MAVDQAEVLAEIDAMIRDMLGEFGAGLTVTADSDFRDLGLESLDVVALAGRIHARYGWRVNFAEFVADLDVRRATEITVGARAARAAREHGGAGAVKTRGDSGAVASTRTGGRAPVVGS